MSEYKTVTETNVAFGIYALMGKVMAEVGAIGKDSTNTQQGFRYRSIDAIYNTLNPLLAKYGVFMAPEVLDKTREERTNKNGTVLAFTCLRMKYTFYAPDGSHVSCVVEGEGMDSGDKSSNKAMAVAHKYALLQTFCIPTEEQKDPDAEVHEVVGAADKALTDRVITSGLEALAKGDAYAMLEIWEELSADEQISVWKEFNSKQKAGIRELLQQARSARTAEVVG